jgi:curved DNA-binding protein
LESGFDPEAARRMREAFGARFGGGAAGHAGDAYSFGELDELLSGLFGASARGSDPRHAGFALRGPDVQAELELDFLEAARGGEKRLQLARPTADGGVVQDVVSVRIPPGVADGGRIRLRGKGGAGLGGGSAGDLYAHVRVRRHPFFRREGLDVYVTLPVTLSEAVLGAKVEVPTLDGRATVSIPPGTDGGARLRLKGKGVPSPDGAAPGDLYAEVRIRVPRDLDDQARSDLERMARFEPESPREELFR